MTVADETLARCATLPVDVLDAVFERYGRPLEVTATLDEMVALSDGTRLGRLRYRSSVDVIANDWFVRVATEPLAIPAPLFVAVVAALKAPRS